MAFPAFTSPLVLSTSPTLTTHMRRSSPHCLRNVAVPSTRVVSRAVAEPASAPAPTADEVKETMSTNVMNTYVRFPLAISHGSGAVLYDLDGKPYLDCVAGIATCTLGHAHPAVVNAVSQQIARTAHVSNLYYIPEQALLAEWLTNNSPGDKVFFCNSGAEANEAAIKLARKRWHLRHGSVSAQHVGTPVIITAEQSFHGRTLATLTATGQPKYHENWWPLVPGFDYVRYNDADHLREVCKRHGSNVAAVMLEALQGEGGVVPGTADFLRTARELCDEMDALLICDEVQVGVGRTGQLWGFENGGVIPDAFTLAKGLGGGVPIGAMVCQSHCDVFSPGDHASTFGGNPLATAAGMAVARELMEGGVLDNVGKRGAQLREGLQDVATRFGEVVKEIRGAGLILGVELVGVKAIDVVNAAMELGLLLVPAGPSVVRLVPPLVITEDQVDEVLARFETALQSVVNL